jgi:hypothetical protein
VAFILFAFPGFVRRIFCLSFLVAALTLLCGCHNASGVSTSLLHEKENVFKRIAVLPFQGLNPEEAAKNAVVITVPASVLKPQNEPLTPERIIQDLFWDGLVPFKKFDLVSPDRAGGIFEQVMTTSFKMTLPEAIRKVGAELEADGVVIGYVYRFRERVGYDYSVEKPASVFFEIQLFRCHDGVLVWKGIFEKTQTSLMENLYRLSYFFKDRGRWITAKELAKEGMDDTLKKFPGLP